MARARSSFTSFGSTTMSRLPAAANAASMCSDLNLASLSRCSTMMVPYSGERSRNRRCARPSHRAPRPEVAVRIALP